jgi:uncharacterized caspase-like protein
MAQSRKRAKERPMRPGGWIWLCATLLAAGLCAVGARAEERVALVVGNSAYAHLPALDSPRNDAAAVAEKLNGLGFNVITGIDLDRAATIKKLQQFRHVLAHAKTALFYYAGHGLEVSGEEYLVPIDADLGDPANPDHGILDLSAVLTAMQHGPRVALVFFDASRDNPLGNAPVPPPTVDASRPEEPARMVVAFASGPGNTAAHGQGDAHSPFTSALLQHMATPGQKIQDMLARVRDTVVQSTGGSQMPWDMSSLDGDFFLASH